MNTAHSITIIGNGVAANVLGFYLRKSERFKDAYIAKVYDDDLFKPCSLLTTSHNCLRNAQRGLSDLGDKLVDAADEFKSFYENYWPRGVHPCPHKHYWREDYAKAHKLARRYRGLEYKSTEIPYFPSDLSTSLWTADNEAYVIESEYYLKWLEEQTKYNEIRVESVKSIDDIKSDIVVLCTGQYTRYFADIFDNDQHVNGSKPVAGTYLEFKYSDFKETNEWFDKGFCFDLEEVNVVFRPLTQTVLIGATSTLNKNNYLDDASVNSMYQKTAELLNGTLNLPSLEKGRYKTGIRHKGHRRLPFWGKINDRTYAVYGLYKNAYTFANLAAKDLLSII
jgi:hypothetical protein